MATIVLHKPTGNHYVLLGTGYGAYQSHRPSVLGGDLFPHEHSGEIPVAAVSDEFGEIHWFLTMELQVAEIDGLPLSRIFAGLRQRRLLDQNRESAVNFAEEAAGSPGNTDPSSDNAMIPDEYCPACGMKVEGWQRECPSCGLTLIQGEADL